MRTVGLGIKAKFCAGPMLKIGTELFVFFTYFYDLIFFI